MGGKKGTLACGVYLLLGAVGLPVFSGFQGGPGVLLGPTGGYLLGFLLLALCYWLLQKKLGQLPALLLGLLLCYGCGTAWFYWMYGGSLWAVLMNCVIPYLIPDGIKLLLAVTVRKRLRL
jgi:biotin transport system substrate-specific component